MRAEAARRARERAPLAPSGPRRGRGVGGGAGGHAAGRARVPRAGHRRQGQPGERQARCCSTTATSSRPTSEGPPWPLTLRGFVAAGE